MFTTEFESTLVIVLKQLFLEGSVNIVEYVVDYSKNIHLAFSE